MELAISRGVKRLAHFESLGVLNEGIGPDRISDLTCNVLIERFVKYTQAVAHRHDIAVETHSIERAAFDVNELRWQPLRIKLPTNPSSSQPVLLVPRRFLRSLPSLDADDFWESPEAAQVRADLNFTIGRNVRKRDIIDLARRDPDAVDRWTRGREGASAKPYDFERDPEGVYNWLRAARAHTTSVVLDLLTARDDADFVSVIDALIADFKHCVEQRGNWKLLINDDGAEKNEEAAQLLFRGIAQARCEANNIVIDREVELGRGTVDFKFSSGYSNRALLEIKKLHNGKFWNGLEQQLPTYLNADQCRVGRFVAIQYRTHRKNSGVDNRRLELPRRTFQRGRELDLDLQSTVVDARRPDSASKL